MLRKACAYAVIFETPNDLYNEFVSSNAPKPFILDLSMHSRKLYLAGDYITFGVTLVGRANDYLPYFILAFDEMGQNGLGKGRGKFVLEAVQQVKPFNSKYVFTAETGEVVKPDIYNGLAVFDESKNKYKMIHNLELYFKTPGRFINNGQLLERMTFEALIRALLRRITWMGRFHCGVDIELDYIDLIEKAKTVKVLKHELKWYDWERYSRRHHSKIKMGGLAGKIVFGEGWTEFLWLLALGEILHVGKGATFGMGRYEIMMPYGKSECS